MPPSEEPAPPTTEFTVPTALRAAPQPTGRKVPVLFVLNGLDAGRLFVIDRDVNTIGR